MDAFFASVEQYDNPELRGKPLAVGHIHRGVVAAASYEARKFGIHSAMPSKIALEKCPYLIFVPPRFKRYREISMQIRRIFTEYTDLVEPLSVDEAYLDVTTNKKGIASANQIAREIRQQIFTETGLTASAGISINKFLAKVASDINKPNGQKTIHPSQISTFLDTLPIEKFYGIGKVTTKKMHQLGVYSGADLKLKSADELIQRFGKAGRHYYNIVRGIHHSEVRPDRIQKSVAVEETFDEDLQKNQNVFNKIDDLTEKLHQRLLNTDIKGKTLTLKIKYKDFNIITRSKTMPEYFSNKFEIAALAKNLWNLRPYNQPIRLIGLSVSNLNTEVKQQVTIQLTLPFEEWI